MGWKEGGTCQKGTTESLPHVPDHEVQLSNSFPFIPRSQFFPVLTIWTQSSYNESAFSSLYCKTFALSWKDQLETLSKRIITQTNAFPSFASEPGSSCKVYTQTMPPNGDIWTLILNVTRFYFPHL